MDEKAADQSQNGKGKAKDDSDGKINQEVDQGSPTGREPLLSRIANSASSLSGALFSGPPSNDVLSTLTGGEKGQSSGAQGVILEAGEASSIPQIRANKPAAFTGLRSAAAEDHAAREEAAFAKFLDGTNPFISSEQGDLEKVWQSAGPVTESLSQRSQASNYASSIAAQEAVDGQDVVDLLWRNDDSLPEFIEDDKLSQQDLSNLRGALFGEGHGSANDPGPPGWDNLLNFIPQYLRLGESGRYRADVRSNSLRAEESSMHLGTSDLGEGWQRWIDQWSDVLTRYQDEVWGDLGSLVQEARAEVDSLSKIEPTEPPPQPKALLRLRNILGHLRG